MERQFEVYHSFMRDAQIYIGDGTSEKWNESDWKDFKADPLMDIVWAEDENEAVKLVAVNEGIPEHNLYAIEHVLNLHTPLFKVGNLHPEKLEIKGTRNGHRCTMEVWLSGERICSLLIADEDYRDFLKRRAGTAGSPFPLQERRVQKQAADSDGRKLVNGGAEKLGATPVEGNQQTVNITHSQLSLHERIQSVLERTKGLMETRNVKCSELWKELRAEFPSFVYGIDYVDLQLTIIENRYVQFFIDFQSTEPDPYIKQIVKFEVSDYETGR